MPFQNRKNAVVVFGLVLGLILVGCGPDRPSAPSNLQGTSQNGAVSLTWSSISGDDFAGYKIYRSQSSFSDVSEMDPINSDLLTQTNFTDNEADNGTTYYYRVTAIAEGGDLLGIGGRIKESSPSDEVAKTPFAEPPTRP